VRNTLVLTAILMSVLVRPAFAWWGTGHMVVANIAYQRLNATAKAEVDRLLTIDALPESKTFVTASVWADDLKSMGVHAHDEWHYLDIPFSPDNSPLPSVERSGNVEWAIGQCVQTLKSAKAPDGEKARALKFLIHFVGDVHQPLHCTARVTKAFPNGDRGGNDFAVKAGRLKNLHSYWDSAAGLFEDVKRPMDSEGEKTINGYSDRATKDNPPSSFQNLTETSYRKWVEEGSALAQSQVYATTEGAEPTDDYKTKAQKTCFRQIALAGYRLADLINAIFPAK
jgi:hypothetical protein